MQFSFFFFWNVCFVGTAPRQLALRAPTLSASLAGDFFFPFVVYFVFDVYRHWRRFLVAWPHLLNADLSSPPPTSASPISQQQTFNWRGRIEIYRVFLSFFSKLSFFESTGIGPMGRMRFIASPRIWSSPAISSPTNLGSIAFAFCFAIRSIGKGIVGVVPWPFSVVEDYRLTRRLLERLCGWWTFRQGQLSPQDSTWTTVNWFLH